MIQQEYADIICTVNLTNIPWIERTDLSKWRSLDSSIYKVMN